MTAAYLLLKEKSLGGVEVIESNEDFTSQIIPSEYKNKEYDSLSAQKIFESWVNIKSE